MKKLILLLIMLTMFFYGNATEDSTKYVTDTNTEKLIDKYTEKIEVGISALAKSLKRPAEHVYGVLVKQRVVKAWTWIGVILLSLLITIVVPAISKRLSASIKEEDKSDGSDEYKILLLIFGIITVIIIICGLKPIISGFFNPEYGAIKEIMRFLN